MKLTENFSLWEFKCRDGTEVPEELRDNVQELAENLQVLREYIQKPITVISGYRSPEYKRSQHMLAKAGDLIVKGMTPDEVKEAIVHLIKEGKMKKGGVGLYTYFTHYDVRGFNRRWYGKGIKDYQKE